MVDNQSCAYHLLIIITTGIPLTSISLFFPYTYFQFNISHGPLKVGSSMINEINFLYVTLRKIFAAQNKGPAPPLNATCLTSNESTQNIHQLQVCVGLEIRKMTQ